MTRLARALSNLPARFRSHVVALAVSLGAAALPASSARPAAVRRLGLGESCCWPVPENTFAAESVRSRTRIIIQLRCQKQRDLLTFGHAPHRQTRPRPILCLGTPRRPALHSGLRVRPRAFIARAEPPLALSRDGDGAPTLACLPRSECVTPYKHT